MTDRENVIKRLEECLSASCRGFRTCPYSDDPEWDAVEAALVLLREQEKEKNRLVNWLGKFCSHVDQHFQPLPDEQNIEFFRQKMKQQFGWEVTGDA